MPKVYLGVGSNLGDRRAFLEAAQKSLTEDASVRFLRSSSIYETEPVGGPPDQGQYLNAVWEIETDLSVRDLLEKIHFIEKTLGRERVEKNEARQIDLDILFYGESVMDEGGIRIPHREMHERLFVLRPLAELIPSYEHPVLHETILELLKRCYESHIQSSDFKALT